MRGEQAIQGPTVPPALAPELVHEFVNVGHGQLVPVKQMLTEQPNLLNATWDWGVGDLEMAIEGAGDILLSASMPDPAICLKVGSLSLSVWFDVLSWTIGHPHVVSVRKVRAGTILRP